MKKIFLILFLLFSINAFANSGSSYAVKIEICIIDFETINGYVKTNDYFIEHYLNNEINVPIKDFIIETVHFTIEKGKFTFFEKSVNNPLKPKININVGYDLYTYQAKI